MSCVLLNRNGAHARLCRELDEGLRRLAQPLTITFPREPGAAKGNRSSRTTLISNQDGQ